jgi:hypothetical protein
MELNFMLFLMVAALSFGATEVIKGIINIFKPEWHLGLVISVVFSTIFMVGIGQGLLAWIAELDYGVTAIPVLVQAADIAATAFILSMGSKGLNAFLENVLGVDLADSFKARAEEYINLYEEEK